MRAPFHPLCATVVAALLGAAACVDLPEGLNRPKVSAAKVSAGDAQIAQVGSEVPVSPAILVLGLDSLPLPGIEVRFSVTVGRGSVSSASRVTDSLGLATVGTWTVGDTPGIDTLIATVVGVGRLRVTATVTPPCPGAATLVLGDSASGTITNVGCLVTGGGRAAAYVVQPFTNVGSVIAISAPTYHARVTMQNGALPVATSIVPADTSAGSQMVVYLGAGTYTLLAQGAAAADRGAFTVTTSAAAIYSGCLTRAYIARGAATLQTIAAGACNYIDTQSNPYFAHNYKIHLAVGTSLVATASAGLFTPYLLVLDESAVKILQDVDAVAAAHSASVNFVAPYSGYFTIAVLAQPSRATGSYTLSVSP